MDYNSSIVMQLKELNKAYREGKPIVPDSVYDALRDKLPENHPYRHKIEPEKLYKGRIKHKEPMLSMQKARTDNDMQKWVNKILDASTIKDNLKIRCTAKLDGIAGKLKDGKLITRGDGIYGNDVTNCIKKGIVFRDDLYSGGLGEFVIDLDYFNERILNVTDFSNARNFTSGAIMAEIENLNPYTSKAFEDKAIAFQFYRDLPRIDSNILTLLDNFRETESIIRDSVNYLIDGVIFEVLDENLKKSLGCTNDYPNWAIALKPKDKIYISVVNEISWATGRTGKVTPTVLIEPIDIDGVKVSRASGHNARMLMDLGIEVGKTVEIIRSGSVIPYIVGVVEDGKHENDEKEEL